MARHFRLIVLVSVLSSFLFLNNCQDVEKKCTNTNCLHGVPVPTFDCICACETGWKGPNCDIPVGANLIECEFSYNGSSPFKYTTTDLHLKAVTSTGADTLYIDSEMASGEWLYFEIIVPDLSILVNDSFPIVVHKDVNTVWMTHQNESILKEIFSPDISLKPSGMLYIDEYSLVSNSVKGRFYATLEAGFSPVVKAIALNGTFSYE